MKILGIDPSLRRTGWGIIEIKTDNNNKIDHIDHGVIITKSAKNKTNNHLTLIGYNLDSIPYKLHILSTSILDLYNKYKPDRIAIEETFCGVNNKTNLKLGFALGTIMSTLGAYNTTINMYPARFIKMTLVKGNASKEDVQNEVLSILNIDTIQSFDMSDALATAICDAIQISK